MSSTNDQSDTYELVEPDAPPRVPGASSAPPAVLTRNRYCRDCGYNLRGVCEPACPECGRAFNPFDHSSYLFAPEVSHRPAQVRQVLWNTAVVVLLYLPMYLGLRGWLFELFCLMIIIFPIWLASMVYFTMRLIPEGRIDSLLAHVLVGAALGAAVMLSLAPFLLPGIVGVLVGAVTGLVRRHQTLG